VRVLAVLCVAALAAATLAVGAAGSPAAERNQLAGRWERVTTCRQIVDALDRVGLRAVAPSVVAGNGLVPGTPRELAAKRDICRGAVPRVHSHFFTRTGQFGSLDWNRAQVDEAPYRVVDARSVTIGPPDWRGMFRYRVVGGKALLLTPVLTPAAKRFALAHPLRFSLAGWMVAVALAGGEWKRVPCVGWC
jgi:hypothetical protein